MLSSFCAFAIFIAKFVILFEEENEKEVEVEEQKRTVALRYSGLNRGERKNVWKKKKKRNRRSRKNKQNETMYTYMVGYV